MTELICIENKCPDCDQCQQCSKTRCRACKKGGHKVKSSLGTGFTYGEYLSWKEKNPSADAADLEGKEKENPC